MKKQELLNTLRKEHNERRDKSLAATEKMYDFMQSKVCNDGDIMDVHSIYYVNGCGVIASHKDFRIATVHWTPINSTENIGAGAGMDLVMNF